MLVDTFGRVATDLRVSLTDKCNLRCSYCMPPEGLEWLPGPDAAHRRRARPAGRRSPSASASTEVRFTGGEPLLRRGLVSIVERVGALDAAAADCRSPPTASGWPRSPAALAAAGLDRVNVSLDTLDRERFVTLARRDRLADVLAGLAGRRGRPASTPVKVNAVLMRGVNDDEAVPLLRWCLGDGYQLRFIEQMPLDAQHGWDRADDGHRRRDPRPAGGRVRR